VTSTETPKDKPYGSLQRLARLVNLLAYSGVPPEHIHIVALLDGSAGVAGFTDAGSRKYMKYDNYNLEILHPLKKTGVKLLICGHAMTEHNMQVSDLDPSMTVALSAFTVPVVYEQRG
jgi:intracellular sulfur oxidation DsrE/DsrF family protein